MNPTNGQSPLDYLNQISAPQEPTKKPFRFSLGKVILLAIIAFVIVIIIGVAVSSYGNSLKSPWQELSARLAVTTEVADGATKNIKNSELRSMNGSLKAYLTNTTRDLAKPLQALGVDPAKLPESVVTKEKGTGITERLEDARLNAKYDSTYAREMSYQLSTILSLYQKLMSQSSNPENRQFIKTSFENLYTIQQAMSEFSASNE